MFIDAFRSEEISLSEVDICIVGSGVAGLSLAREFLDSKYTVLVVESGDFSGDNGTNALNAGIIDGLPYRALINGRTRGFGGTSELWGGQCTRMNKLDFEQRDWVPFSGWPITYDEVAGFYPRAAEVFGLRRDVLDGTCTQDFPINELGIDHTTLQTVYSAFSPKRFLGRELRAILEQSSNISVLLNGTVTELLQDESGSRISGVSVRASNRSELTIRAKTFVLSCGAIENARLLLVSRRKEEKGVGNRRDLVGRFLQDHVIATVAEIDAKEPRTLYRGVCLVRRSGGIRYSQKLGLSDDLQKKNRVLNGVATIEYDDNNVIVEPLVRVYRALRTKNLRQAGLRDYMTVMAHPMAAIRAAATNLGYALPSAALGGSARLSCVVEQAPNPDSRILLSDSLDSLGVPRIKVQWILTDSERNTLRVMAETFTEEFNRLGIGSVSRFDWIDDDGSDWGKNVCDILHASGTTRMSDNPGSGVVNTNCKVFDVENLYLAGSSVFPTSGYANPVFTMTALAIRLGDHLKLNLSAE